MKIKKTSVIVSKKNLPENLAPAEEEKETAESEETVEAEENYASIEEQKRIIQDYAISRNWTISDFYIDDNVSGYTFNRPAFSKMIEKVKGGKVDVVIVKDLSRIGRNNGRVLVLIDDFKNMQKNSNRRT